MSLSLRMRAANGLVFLQNVALYLSFQFLCTLTSFGVSSSSLLAAETLGDTGAGTATATDGNQERDEPSGTDHRGIALALSQCRLETLDLPKNRKLSIAHFGAPNGPAVFCLHGYPECRLIGAVLDQTARRLGARVIAVSRPGIGDSTPQPGRTPLDHAEDIRLIAEHLRIDSYGVLGISGGGPYALACAHALPEDRVRAVSVVGGIGPIDVEMRQMSWQTFFLFTGLIYAPFLVRWLQYPMVAFLGRVSNETIVDVIERKKDRKPYKWLSLAEQEQMMVGDPALLTMMLDCQREHYQQGVGAFMEDGRVLSTDWGFRLGDIRKNLPVQLWYSRQDKNVPFRIGEEVAARLGSRPEVDFHVVENESHFRLVLDRSSEALEHLVKKLQAS